MLIAVTRVSTAKLVIQGKGVAKPSVAGPDSETLRRLHKIRCAGTDIPPAWSTFAAFPQMPKELLGNLANMGVLQPTPIQMQAPSIMLAGRDLLACAPTGSGKTLSYLLPLLLSATQASGEQRRANTPLAVVVEPTRELARQVYTEASRIKPGTSWRVKLLGEADTEHGAVEDVEGEDHMDLLISTPLKLVFAVKEKTIDLSKYVRSYSRLHSEIHSEI
jgi:ATP-dependent RNA helicase DDX52/ROK1